MSRGSEEAGSPSALTMVKGDQTGEQRWLKRSRGAHLHLALATGRVSYHRRLAPGESSDVVPVLDELRGTNAAMPVLV